VSSRTAKAIQRNPVLKNKKKKNKNKKKKKKKKEWVEKVRRNTRSENNYPQLSPPMGVNLQVY
jgi:hypothetical protein